MLVTTNEINQAWRADGRKMQIKVMIGGVTYDNDTVTSLSFDSGSISGESFQLGSTYMNSLEIVFPSILETIREDIEVQAELGILVNGIYEYAKLGKFIISEFNRDRNSNTTTITAVDQMILMEGIYESKLSYPATIRDVALEIANLSGVVIDPVSFSTLPTSTIKKLEGYTCRQAIGIIAQFEGGFANFNRLGQLQIRRLAPNDFSISASDYLLKGFKKNEKTYRINGIRVRTGEEDSDVLTVGTSVGNVVELENKAMTQQLLNAIWSKVEGISYFPFELKWRGNPNLEAGDWINILDRDGNRYSVPNLSYSFVFNGGLTAESKATTVGNSEVTYSYKGPLKQQIIQIQKVLEGANGWNSNYYDETEPQHPKEGDLWFKPNGQYKEIWTYENVNGILKWVLQISDAPDEAIKQAIDQAEKNIAQNIIDIESALDKATQAELDAGFSKDLAGEAKALGVAASSLAGEATTNANKAMTDAQEAIRQVVLNGGVAADASAEATEARRLASLAEGNAQEALTKANTSVTDASKALTDATKAFNKSFKSSAIAYATSTNGSTPPTTGWLSTVPTPSPDVYIWTRTTILLNDNTPVVSYSVGKIGAKGDQGLKGDTGGQGIQGLPGVNAPTITSVVQQFYLSTSTTTQTGGSWLSTVPVWSSGRYYWVRVATTYSNGSTTTSTPVLDNALNDSLVTALEVKTANQNLSTTVTQHATLIESKANSTTVDAIAGRVTTAEGSISTIAGKVELKANSTDVQTLTGRVITAEGTITTQAGQIALKANTTTVNTLTGRVATAEGNITTQAGQIELRATKADVQTLDGRVTTAEGSINVQAGQIASKVSQTDFNTLSGRVGTAESSISQQAGEIALRVTTTTYNAGIGSKENTITKATTAPAHLNGRLWLDTSVTPNVLNRSTGTAWVKVTPTTPGEVGAYSAGDGSALAGRVSTAETSITANTTAINLRATKTDLDATKGRVTTAEGTINVQAGQIALKANQTTVDTLTGRVGTAETNISANTTAINLRATKTDVNALTGRVTTAEGTITAQAGLIALKANQSVVDTLTGRVSTTEAKITATDGKVTTLTTKTDGNTTSIGQLQTSYSGLSSTVTQVKNNLEGMEIGGRNLIVNTESLDGYSYKTSDKYMNFNIARTKKGSTGYSDTFSATTIDIAEGDTYTASFFARTSVASFIVCHWYSPNTTIYAISSTGQVSYGADGGIQVTTSTDWKRYWVTWIQSTTTNVKRLIIGRNTITPEGTLVEISGVKIEKGNKATDWSPAPEDYTTVTAFSALEQNLNGFKTTVQNTYADKTTVTQLAGQWTTTTNLANGHTSQIASLGTDINLRATKADLISQINLSPESILIASAKIQIKGDTYIESGVIKTAHIADLAVSGAKIANASIASAKIISLDAAKITATSLSAITTNTGALNVSGWLTTTTENYGFRGTYNYGDELYGAYNPRWFDGDYRLSHRYLTFQANVYDVNSNNTRGAFKYYGETFYGADYLKLRQYTSSTNKTIRARVDVTADSIIIGPNFNGAQSIILNSNATSFFAKDASFADGITVNSQNQDGVRTGRINAPMNYNTLILNNNRNLGTLELGYDTSRYLRAKDVYDRTYSLASNMIVTNEGTLGRATSARKYKTNIVELKEIYSKAKDVLQIQPVTWLDKRALIETGTEQRGYGFIADEFHELGLKEVVQYGSDGQVEGLAYDRISMYHNVILQDHEQQLKRLDSLNTKVIRLVANSSTYGTRLNNLESEVFRLKKCIEELEKIA